MNDVENFERRLVKNLQPIRFYALATAIYNLFDSKIYSYVNNNPDCSIEAIAVELNLNQKFLEAFLLYLRNENLIIYNIATNKVSLSKSGQDLENFEPWYIMLIGGYSSTFNKMGEVLQNKILYAPRKTDLVGIGSCGISHYDAIPLTKKLMAYINTECNKLLDLGCGNGLYLLEFCKQFPEFQAYGAEPDEKSCKAAKVLIEEAGMSESIKIFCTTAKDFFKLDINYNPDLIVLGFILQEILGQEGEEGVVQFLLQIIKSYPDINIIVIEVDNLSQDLEAMQHPLAVAYYNPYFLLHHLTPQKLERRSYWRQLFISCGLEIVQEDTVNLEVDSTTFEIGFLLKKINNA